MAGEFEQRDLGVESMGPDTATSADDARAADGAREKVRAASRDLLDQAVERKDELKQRAASAVDERAHGFAQRGDAITQALHGAATTLRDNGETQLSGWVEQAAGQVERVVGYLRGSQPDGMMNDLEDLARRNPAMFLGGTYVAGLALGRFLRAASPERRQSDQLGDVHEQNRTAGGVGETSVSTGYETGAQGTASAGISTGYDSTATPGRTQGGGISDTGLGTNGWSGVGVAPGAFNAQVSDAATSPGASDAGLTDEDLRSAWHGEADRGEGTTRPDYGASGAHDGTDTGQLTRYTNDENEDDASRSR